MHYLDAWRYTAWFNLLQNPAVSVPVLDIARGPANRRAGRDAPVGGSASRWPPREVIEESRGPWTPPPAPFGATRSSAATQPVGPPRTWSARQAFDSSVGLALSLATIGGVGLYTVHEIRALRDEQTAISERNRKDSLQLLRIQNNLAGWPRRCGTWRIGRSPIRWCRGGRPSIACASICRRRSPSKATLAPAERPGRSSNGCWPPPDASGARRRHVPRGGRQTSGRAIGQAANFGQRAAAGARRAGVAVPGR